MNEDFRDIGFRILKINEDSNYYTVRASALTNGQKSEFCFKFKKTLVPAMYIIKDEKGFFKKHIKNEEFSWDSHGSSIELDDTDGKRFVNLLLKYYGLKEVDVVKKNIIFDTALLFGDLDKMPVKDFHRDGLDYSVITSSNQLMDVFTEGKDIPNIIKLKLENVIQNNPLIRVQFFVVIDLDKNYLYFLEKDAEFRNNFHLMFKK